jgi:hypothetical protein
MLQSLWLRLTSARPGPRRHSPARGKRPPLFLEPLEARALLSAIVTYAGRGTEGFSGDGGTATRAQMDQPSGITVDAKGNVYFIDDFNERVRKVAPNHKITTVAGTGITGDDGDGGPATQATFQFGEGGGIAVDAQGDIYIADPTKSRVRVITPDGIIHPFAGSFNNEGNRGDGGLAVNAALMDPFALAVDSRGDVFIADSGANNIREVTPDGIIHTVAGNGTGGFSGDGGRATSAEIFAPSDIAVDGQGDLFILDSGNNRVREVTTDGIMHTIAGNGTAGFSGDKGLAVNAQLNFTFEGGLAVDVKGDVFIADSGNNRIREVTTDGMIKTVAGNGTAGHRGDHGSPIKAQLNNPTGLAIDAKGDLFIADTFNSRIRKIAGIAAH